MKIKKILSRNRRDLVCIYVCEHCDHEDKSSGYDDDHFHATVIPAMKCPKCGRSADAAYQPSVTKYAEGQQV